MFKALLLENLDGFTASVQSLEDARLRHGDGKAALQDDVTVAVAYSSLNYKDGLAITNKSPVVRTWPMVAGIDGCLLYTSDAADE